MRNYSQLTAEMSMQAESLNGDSACYLVEQTFRGNEWTCGGNGPAVASGLRSPASVGRMSRRYRVRKSGLRRVIRRK